MPVAIPKPINSWPSFRERGVDARLCQPIAAAPFAVTRHQGLGGEQFSGVLILGRKIDLPELEGIDAGFMTKFVDRALNGIDADGRAGCSHVARCCGIELCEVVAELDVVAVVQHA
jgi:hypothetical protein